ncbi:hypothetical protein [Pajaroellobacter abortibovis]|uniref:Uncharacterized protein n=1 Tax=Pajaroellobacter abortibovis TaxID=1882918 RepID=A0A1L6MW19_9BACT|nr:hypothetical protein [Pajaroellobacter abortibovis]APR99628.1 hypothetical protein BCY86_02260 [Pajaroellobacter abortibovis]
MNSSFFFSRTGRNWLAVACWVAGPFWILSCKGVGSVPQAQQENKVSFSETQIVHEPCDVEGSRVREETLNVQGKKLFVLHVLAGSGGSEICRMTNLTGNEKGDIFEYFWPTGKLRRREVYYDNQHKAVAISLFDEEGRLVRRLIAVLGTHQADTIDYFDPATGQLVRRGRDSMGRGVFDQWWFWKDGELRVEIKDPDQQEPLSIVFEQPQQKQSEEVIPPAGGMDGGVEGGVLAESGEGKEVSADVGDDAPQAASAAEARGTTNQTRSSPEQTQQGGGSHAVKGGEGKNKTKRKKNEASSFMPEKKSSSHQD